MIFIGKNRRQGISDIQQRLNYIARPTAEGAYLKLLSEGLIVEHDFSVYLDEAGADHETLQKVVRQSQAEKESKTKMQRRRSMTTMKCKITSLNYVDMIGPTPETNDGTQTQDQGDQGAKPGIPGCA